MDAITNSVLHMLPLGETALLGIQARYEEKGSTVYSDAQLLRMKLESRAQRGELLTNEQKIALAEYVLEYKVAYDDMAEAILRFIDGKVESL